jgi:hypothetical protein
VAAEFKRNGKVWNDQVEKRVKEEVSKAVAADPGSAVHQQRTTALDALVKALEERMMRYGSE